MYSADFLTLAADEFNNLAQSVKTAYIKKMPGGKYRVLSSKGKNLGTYDSKELAAKRLKQVELFKFLRSKRIKKASKNLDLTKIEAFSLSSIMRQINKQLGQKACINFMSLYKRKFDHSVAKRDNKAEEKALIYALKKLNEECKIEINSKFVKLAAAAAPQLGDPRIVGKYLSNIIIFTLNKISPDRRPKSINNVKNKIHRLNEMEISQKKMPASASIGQSITFVKHVLFGQNPQYIRQVLNYIFGAL